MVFNIMLTLLPLLLVSLDVAAQTKRTCSEGLCFETASLTMNNTDITLGFAMPEDDCGEFLVNASIPLPYGFLSFTMGDNEYDYNSHPKAVALFIDLIVIPGPDFKPLNLSDVRAQLSTQQGEKLVPYGDAQSFPSPLSNRTADNVHMLARMNGSQLKGMPFLSDKVALMTAMFSLNAPEYVDPQNEKAELYTNGSKPVGFQFNAAAARFSNYTEMLKIAGFDS